MFHNQDTAHSHILRKTIPPVAHEDSMGRRYTEEEKLFLSQVMAPFSSGLQTTSTLLTIQEEGKQNHNIERKHILDPTGNTYNVQKLDLNHREKRYSIF